MADALATPRDPRADAALAAALRETGARLLALAAHVTPAR